MRQLASLVTSRLGAIVTVLIFFALSAVLLAGVGQAERDPAATDALARGAESTKAELLAERLPDQQESTAVVLFTKDNGDLSPADLATLTQKAMAQPGVKAPAIPSRDGSAALVVVPIDAEDATTTAAAVRDLRAHMKRDLPVGVSSQVTGPAAIQADLAAVFEGANTRLLAATAGVVAVLLVITYRSPVLFLIPLTVVGLGDQVAAVVATRVLSATGTAWDESTIGILSVLVFGAGTDYALLLISRYRDELRTTTDRRQAMATALRRTAEAVTSSALTVFVGLLTLLLSLFPATRGLGLACAVGVVVAAIFVMVMLPAVLVCFGRWIFWPRVPRAGEARLSEGQSGWRRIGDAVARRPWTFVVTTLVLLGIAAGGISQIRTGLSDADQFLRKPEAIAAGERLAESFPAGSADPVRIITESDPAAVTSAVEGVSGVSSVRPGPTGDGLSEIQVVIAADSGSAAARQTIGDLREAVDRFPQTYVGGSEAKALDTAAASARDRWVVLPIILGLVLLALIVLLRSLVAPLVLVATVVATYLSSLGISWVLFTQVFGFERMDDGAPLLAFVFLVALGVDYNIFLVTRAREESREHGAREGMLRGLAATGGVITSAGILLAAVFAVLGVLPLVVLAQIGIIIGVGVLLDTLVVRTVLVPAIALLLGDRFWWPRRTRVVA